MKLVVDEAGSEQLRDLVVRTDAVSSALIRTELRRAVARLPGMDVRPRAEQVLDDVALLSLDAATLDRAGRLRPISLRSLDAVHLAGALLMVGDISALVTYDVRLADAAREHGLEVWSPGAAV